MVKYSIIIPHHNIPVLLQRCLDSIPDIDEIQVIIVDDNSDESLVTPDSFPGVHRSNTEVYFTKEGKGAGYARNVGLKHAKGKWLLFADADDYFTDNMLKTVDSFFSSSADMILFKALSVNSDTLEPADRNTTLNNLIDSSLKGTISEKQVALSVHVPWCRMIRSDLVKMNNITFDEIIASNDTMFTTKVSCLANEILLSPDMLYVVTYRSGSLWDNKWKNPDNYLIRLETLIRRNKYVHSYGYKKIPVGYIVLHAWRVSLRTFIKALVIAIKNKALFDGLGAFLKKN